MINIDAIELTSSARFRKLALSAFAIGGGLFVQYSSGQPITWPIMALVFGVALSFNSSDTMEKFFKSDIGKALKSKLPGGK
jgi:hypothetical protein